MSSISPLGLLPLSSSLPRATTSTASRYLLPLLNLNPRYTRSYLGSVDDLGFRRPVTAAAGSALTTKPLSQPRNGVYTVGEFMTGREELHVVKPTTTVDEELHFYSLGSSGGTQDYWLPVIDDDWKLVGLVSDYDLLALDSISGSGRGDTDIFPEVDSSWKTFNEVQKLLSKTNGQVVGDLMTPAPLVVRESTNLEDAARLLLQTKYRRLPVVDSDGRLVGIITRGNVVRAALTIKRNNEREA